MIAKILICLLLGVPLVAHGSTIDSRCASMAQAKLANATITAAQTISSGTFTPPIGDPVSDLPPFCRVAATLKPTPDSNIKIEVWMPEQNWNGRFLGTGNGGGAGKINYNELMRGLRRGFAVANTDMGTSPDAQDVVDHPERFADFGYRSAHTMTVAGKEIVEAFYGKPESHSYFVGCSTGGGQALMEAQRFPADYNGIIAGAPANNRTHIHTGFLWNLKATNFVDGTQIPAATVAWVNKSILAACVGKDGGSPKDDFLTDPRECKFNPATLPVCRPGEQTDCLTGLQLTALKQIQAGPTNPRTGERIYTPIPIGSENSQPGVVLQENFAEMSKQFYPFEWAFGANFDYTKFDYDHDQDLVDQKLAPILNANNPDLSDLQKRGGKILMFTGTADPLVPYQDALNYYDRVIDNQHGLTKTQDFFRYFLVPGMSHCANGPGLDDFGQLMQMNGPLDRGHDLLTALVGWVEQGKAPDQIIASRYVDDKAAKGIELQRPICPYPKFPSYTGGDWKSASSYQCVDHPRGMVLKPAKRYLN